ncbi:MAG: hypothetical protein JNL72_04275 [Flavipsychrobacter sp.]|nr:hypothetical protein [Flavipsychrobacter sp.]
MSRKAKYIFLLVLLFVSAAGIIGYRIWNRPPDTVDSQEGVPVTAVALVKEFAADEAKANTRYAGKALSVSGMVSGTERDQDGGTMLLLQSEDPTMTVQCAMQPGSPAVENGRQVTVKGFYSASSMFGVSLTGCIVQ